MTMHPQTAEGRRTSDQYSDLLHGGRARLAPSAPQPAYSVVTNAVATATATGTSAGRALIDEARVSTEERDGCEYVVRHLAPQFGPVSEFPRASGVSNATRG